jgi:hypothetical protein
MIWEDITLDVAIVFHSFCSTVSRHMMKETFVLPGSKILTKSWDCQITWDCQKTWDLKIFHPYFTHISADGVAPPGVESS